MSNVSEIPHKPWSNRGKSWIADACLAIEAKSLPCVQRVRPVASILSVAFATAVMLPARSNLGVLNVALIYLLLCFAVALIAGARPAALAALLSFVVFDFFFIPPYHTFSVAQAKGILALFVYLVVAAVTGQLVARIRERTAEVERESKRTSLLYELNAALVGNASLDQILNSIAERVVSAYGAAAGRILIPDESDQLQVRARYPALVSSMVDRQGLAIARWAMDHRAPARQRSTDERRRIFQPAGLAAATSPRQPRQDALFLPIATADRVIGVLQVDGKPGGGSFDAADEQLLASFANQAAIALEQGRLADDAAKAAVLAQSDELKSSLLVGVSHDLRTPLATIKAATTSLLDSAVEWSQEERDDLLHAIDEETDRLSLVVGNLLDLTRIEGGVLRPDKAWYDVPELIEDVAGRLAPRAVASDHQIHTEVAPDLPLIECDYVEIAQVLMNLGDNALKFSPPGACVCLRAQAKTDAILFEVEDNGKGIAPRHLPHLFDRFYRVDTAHRAPGLGVGLSIAKGLVEAHGGRIWVTSEIERGTTFHFSLPASAAGTSSDVTA
ncbi:MAG: ATP-binding protein [Thermomicrobiales bacterium]